LGADDTLVDAYHQRVDGDLLQDEASVVAFGVDAVGIPLAEVIVWAFVDGVIEVVCSRVECDFIEKVWIELGFAKNRRWGFEEDLVGFGNQFLVGAECDSDISDV